jgi:hypothetical protein
MTRRVLILTICLTVPPILGTGVAVAEPSASPSVGAFEGALTPYGDWVFVNDYGRVWRPSPDVVGVGFRPYATGGHWVYTDYGWSFESDWDWGWAPFHYGRWFLDQVYGWVWVPDSTWGPAWVDWRYGDGYVGWAPIAPHGVSISYGAYSPYWCFVDETSFVNYDVYRYALPYERVHRVWPLTAPVREVVSYGNTRYVAGPPVSRVASAVGLPIKPVRIAPPRAGVVVAVRPQVVAQPQTARHHFASPYHAIATGSAPPKVNEGVRVIPVQSARPAPAPAQPRPAPPALVPRAAPAPAARPMAVAPPLHSGPASGPRGNPGANRPLR